MEKEMVNTNCLYALKNSPRSAAGEGILNRQVMYFPKL